MMEDVTLYLKWIYLGEWKIETAESMDQTTDENYDEDEYNFNQGDEYVDEVAD
jgi:hypothetical protein